MISKHELLTKVSDIFKEDKPQIEILTETRLAKPSETSVDSSMYELSRNKLRNYIFNKVCLRKTDLRDCSDQEKDILIQRLTVFIQLLILKNLQIDKISTQDMSYIAELCKDYFNFKNTFTKRSYFVDQTITDIRNLIERLTEHVSIILTTLNCKTLLSQFKSGGIRFLSSSDADLVMTTYNTYCLRISNTTPHFIICSVRTSDGKLYHMKMSPYEGDSFEKIRFNTFKTIDSSEVFTFIRFQNDQKLIPYLQKKLTINNIDTIALETNIAESITLDVVEASVLKNIPDLEYYLAKLDNYSSIRDMLAPISSIDDYNPEDTVIKFQEIVENLKNLKSNYQEDLSHYVQSTQEIETLCLWLEKLYNGIEKHLRIMLERDKDCLFAQYQHIYSSFQKIIDLNDKIKNDFSATVAGLKSAQSSNKSKESNTGDLNNNNNNNNNKCNDTNLDSSKITDDTSLFSRTPDPILLNIFYDAVDNYPDLLRLQSVSKRWQKVGKDINLNIKISRKMSLNFFHYCRMGSWPNVLFLALSPAIDVNVKESMQTVTEELRVSSVVNSPLSLVCSSESGNKENELKIFDLLLNLGAETDIVENELDFATRAGEFDVEQKTPMLVAIGNGKVEIVRRILQQYKDLKIDYSFPPDAINHVNDITMLNVLQEAGARLDQYVSLELLRHMCWRVCRRPDPNAEALFNGLIELKQNVSDDLSLINIAINYANLKVIKILMLHGVDIYKSVPGKKSPYEIIMNEIGPYDSVQSVSFKHNWKAVAEFFAKFENATNIIKMLKDRILNKMAYLEETGLCTSTAKMSLVRAVDEASVMIVPLIIEGNYDAKDLERMFLNFRKHDGKSIQEIFQQLSITRIQGTFFYDHNGNDDNATTEAKLIEFELEHCVSELN